MKRKLFYLLLPTTLMLTNNTVIFAKEPIVGEKVSFPLDKKSLAPKNYKSLVINDTYDNESIKIKETQGWFWGSESKEYPTKGILVYEIGVIDAPYVHTVVGYLPKGSTFEYSIKKIEEFNYSNELAVSTQNIYKASLSAEGNIYALKAIGEYEKAVQIKLGAKITTSYKRSIEERTSVTIPIEESGYYFDDFRATYNLYEVQEYQITNTRTEAYRKPSGLATDVFYNVTQTCICSNISYICEYVADCGRCLVKYNQMADGTFVYDGPKSCEGIMYI